MSRHNSLRNRLSTVSRDDLLCFIIAFYTTSHIPFKMKINISLVALTLVLRTFAGPAGQIVLQGSSLDASQFPPEYAVNEERLLEFEDGSRVWKTELEKMQLKGQGARFFDVTDTPDLGSTRPFTSAPTITSLKYNETIFRVTKTLSTEDPKANLQKFTSFYNRYYRADSGRQSQLWLLNRINEITNEFASSDIREFISVKEFDHPWSQKSIVLRIAGGSLNNETVIVGAHQDSTHIFPFLAAPGADDDGSGSVTILEAYRGLIVHGIRPKRNLEFHWYSAEEGGLLGSQAIAQSYSSDRVNVVAMIQFDMTAWVKKGTREEIGIVGDYVDPALSETLKELVQAYTDLPFVDTQCGYGCSDHASWNKAGFPSCTAFESAFENMNPNIHSGSDKIDISSEFSFEHMLQFSKLATAFAIELSELDD